MPRRGSKGGSYEVEEVNESEVDHSEPAGTTRLRGVGVQALMLVISGIMTYYGVQHGHSLQSLVMTMLTVVCFAGGTAMIFPRAFPNPIVGIIWYVFVIKFSSRDYNENYVLTSCTVLVFNSIHHIVFISVYSCE